MVERTKNFGSSIYMSNEEIKALIIASKTELKDREDLFNKVYTCVLDFFFDIRRTTSKININEEQFERLMIEIKKIIEVPRFNPSWNSNLPENNWDYFEQCSFIKFIRKDNSIVMEKLLKEFKGGKYFRK